MKRRLLFGLIILIAITITVAITALAYGYDFVYPAARRSAIVDTN